MSKFDNDMDDVTSVGRDILFFALIGAMVVIIGLGLAWIVQGNDFFMYRYFAPKQEQVRREVFEQSKAYNDGMIQELRTMQLDYIKGTKEQKDGMRSVILHKISGYPEDNLPSDLKQFVHELEMR